jgi:hypothetical protein
MEQLTKRLYERVVGAEMTHTLYFIYQARQSRGILFPQIPRCHIGNLHGQARTVLRHQTAQLRSKSSSY